MHQICLLKAPSNLIPSTSKDREFPWPRTCSAGSTSFSGPTGARVGARARTAAQGGWAALRAGAQHIYSPAQACVKQLSSLQGKLSASQAPSVAPCSDGTTGKEKTLQHPHAPPGTRHRLKCCSQMKFNPLRLFLCSSFQGQKHASP